MNTSDESDRVPIPPPEGELPPEVPTAAELLRPSKWWHRPYASTVFYPTLAWNVLLGRVLRVRRWWDFIDPHVIVGARPMGKDVGILHELGVRAVVNTCEETRGPVDLYKSLDVEQLHVPTTDFQHPTLQSITESVEFVQRHVQAGHIVYIHCKAGRARSATVAMCWLIAHRGMTPDAAQALLLEKRPHIHPRLTERPVVGAFFRQLAVKDEAEEEQLP